MPILLYGTEEQRRTWLPDLASGRRLAAFGLTEPGAGIRRRRDPTRAELRDGRVDRERVEDLHHERGHRHHRLRDDHRRHRAEATEISNLIVPNGTPGLEISAPISKLGWHASDTRELSFRDCAVPEDNLLGERGAGFRQFLEILDGGRISVAAMGVGLAQGAYELAAPYARSASSSGADRRVPGGPFKLADMATEIEAARALVYARPG